MRRSNQPGHQPQYGELDHRDPGEHQQDGELLPAARHRAGDVRDPDHGRAGRASNMPRSNQRSNCAALRAGWGRPLLGRLSRASGTGMPRGFGQIDSWLPPSGGRFARCTLLAAGAAYIIGVSACCILRPLGGRSTVGHVALDHVIGVRIPASQPD